MSMFMYVSLVQDNNTFNISPTEFATVYILGRWALFLVDHLICAVRRTHSNKSDCEAPK